MVISIKGNTYTNVFIIFMTFKMLVMESITLYTIEDKPNDFKPTNAWKLLSNCWVIAFVFAVSKTNIKLSYRNKPNLSCFKFGKLLLHLILLS